MASPAAVLNIVLTANTLQANAALAKTQGQLAATGKTATASGLTMKRALGGVAVGAAAAGVALFKIGEEFDDAYDKIRTRTGATGKEMKKLKGAFRDVVSDVPATFEDASTAVGDLNTRLGLSGRPLKQMSKQMLELSRITETDVEGNVKAVSRAFVDWEVKTKDQSKTLDGFFRLSQESGLAVSDIAESIQKFGSPLRQLGFDLEEAAAMFASFERAGVNSQTMVPGFKLAISNLTRPTDALAETMKKLGVETGKPDVALRQVFDLMTSKGIPTAEKTGLAMDVFGKRAGSDMAEAIKQGRFELDDFMKVMKDGDGTILESGRKTQDLAEHWQQFTNVLKLKLEPIAEDVFKGLGDLMKDVTKAFKQGGIEEVIKVLLDRLNEAIPKVVAAGGKIAGALLKGILNAGVWVQLAAGAFLVKKLGGFAAIQGTGKTVGQRLGRGMLIGWLLALPLIAKELHDWVRARRETIINAGIDFGEWFVNGLIDAVNLGIRAINDAMDDLNALAAFGVDAPEIGEIGKVDWGPFRENMQQGTEIVRATQKTWDNLWGKAKDSAGKNSIGAWHYWRDSLGKTRDRGERDAPAFFNVLRDAYQGISRSADKEGGDAFRYWRGWLDQTQNKGKTASNRFRGDVAGNFERLANASINAIAVLASETNKTLSSLKVKDQVYVARKVKGGGQEPVLSQRGSIIQVPGTGSGDKVPALLEPGEVVINREAVRAMGGAQRANRINQMIPRFARGGTVPGDTAGLSGGILGLVNRLYSRFGGSVSSGVRPGDPGFHGRGLAADYVPNDWTGASRAVNSIGSKLLEGIYNPGMFGGSPVSWDSGSQVSSGFWGAEWGNHLDHIHLAVAGKVGEIAGAVVAELSKVTLKGPKGPLRDMGQRAIDKISDAASRFISSKAPTGTTGDISGELMTGSGEVERVFARVAKKLSSSKTATLALGEAGYHESGMRDLSYGHSSSQGALQLLASTAAGMGISPHDEAAISSAFLTRGFWGKGGANSLAAQGLPAHVVAHMVQGNATGTGVYAAERGRAEAWMQRFGLKEGGIVQALAKGGRAGGKKKPKPPKVDVGQATAGLPGELSGKIERLRSLVADLEEQIATAEILHSFASSPAGSDLSWEERVGEIALNDQLLAGLHEFVGKLEKGIGKLPPRSPLRRELIEELALIQGPPYSASKILGVRQKLDDLRNPPASETGPTDAEIRAEMKLPLVQQQLEEAWAANFLLRSQMPTLRQIANSVPQFAQGGVVPGPVGAPVAAVVHGGETITPPGAAPHIETNVYVDPFSLQAEVEHIVDGQVRRAQKTKIVAGRKTG